MKAALDYMGNTSPVGKYLSNEYSKRAARYTTRQRAMIRARTGVQYMDTEDYGGNTLALTVRAFELLEEIKAKKLTPAKEEIARDKAADLMNKEFPNEAYPVEGRYLDDMQDYGNWTEMNKVHREIAKPLDKDIYVTKADFSSVKDQWDNFPDDFLVSVGSLDPLEPTSINGITNDAHVYKIPKGTPLAMVTDFEIVLPAKYLREPVGNLKEVMNMKSAELGFDKVPEVVTKTYPTLYHNTSAKKHFKFSDGELREPNNMYGKAFYVKYDKASADKTRKASQTLMTEEVPTTLNVVQMSHKEYLRLYGKVKDTLKCTTEEAKEYTNHLIRRLKGADAIETETAGHKNMLVVFSPWKLGNGEK